MATLIASPTPRDREATLSIALSTVQPGDTIHLRGGDYPGLYVLSVPDVTIEMFPGDPPAVFRGPPTLTKNKVAWLTVRVGAARANIRGLSFVRAGDIAAHWTAGWNDYGIVIEAPDAWVENCTLYGMAKGIHVKGKESTRGSIVHCSIGPTIDSCIAMATSYGVVRGFLIGWNQLTGSLREDGVQFMQDFDLPPADQEKDVSNLGTILYENIVTMNGENAFDMKGAGRIIIHGGQCKYTGGYSNGYPFDPKTHYDAMSIMHGARTTSGHVIIRNVDLSNNGGGIKLYPQWHVYHNLLTDNNYDPSGRPWAGTGILQPGATPGAALKNNLSSGHKKANYDLAAPTADFRCNLVEPGPGEALTTCKGDGFGAVLPVADAGYFTDWFGRTDLPPDVICLNSQQYEIAVVDLVENTLLLDREAEWKDGDPVFWRSPAPMAGIQLDYVPPPIAPPVDGGAGENGGSPPIDGGEVEPPPDITEPPIEPPPDVETVRVTISFDIAPEAGEAIRAAMQTMTITVEDVVYESSAGVTVAGAVPEAKG